MLFTDYPYEDVISKYVDNENYDPDTEDVYSLDTVYFVVYFKQDGINIDFNTPIHVHIIAKDKSKIINDLKKTFGNKITFVTNKSTSAYIQY